MKELLARFLDDRHALDEEELRQLARHLEAHPAELAELRAQLAADELLSRRFDERRAVFVARVKQSVEAGGAASAVESSGRDPFVSEVKRRAGLKQSAWTERLRHWVRARPLFAWPIAVCFIIAAMGAWLLWPSTAARVAEAVGDVRVARGQKTFTAQAGFKLEAGDWLLTGSNGTAAVSFPGEATRVAVGTNAELGLVSTAPGKQLRFLSGTLRASVARQPASHPMLLRTPTARAEVLGTKFELNVRASGTRLAVEEGRVLFATTNDESGVVIEASQSAVVTAGEPVTLEITPLAQRLNSGLLAHWTFDGAGDNALRDVSGNGRDLITSTGAVWSAGRIGRALDLHAAKPEVESPRLKLPGTFTVAFWARLDPDAPSRPHPLLALDSQTGREPEFSLALQPTRAAYGLVFEVRGRGLDARAFAAPAIFAPSRWHHVAIIVDSAQGRAAFHVNGRDVTATGALRPGFQLNGVLRVGRRVAGGPLPFDGQLDDLRIYARSLAPAEITALAQGEMTAK